MAFINEYVNEKNIKKYNLEALYRKLKWDENWTPPGFRFAWTFDAERDCYYIPLWHGREEFSHHCRSVLYFKDIHWNVEVTHEPGGSESIAENPYRIIWGFVHIKSPDGGPTPLEELIPVLKEALIAYKVRGIHTNSKVTSVVTSFTF